MNYKQKSVSVDGSESWGPLSVRDGMEPPSDAVKLSSEEMAFLAAGTHRFDAEGALVPVTSQVTRAMVKSEAARRIEAIAPGWKQRNLTARAVEMIAQGKAAWTASDRAEWGAGMAIWERIKAVRAASDGLEALGPIPEDYTDDKYWK